MTRTVTALVKGKGALGLLAAVSLLGGAGACGSARRAPPLVGPQPAAEQQQAGRRVFLDKCDFCHPGGEAGLGPSLNDKPLPRAAIKLQVRKGLGAMPDFDPQELADPELERVADYLLALRRQGR